MSLACQGTGGKAPADPQNLAGQTAHQNSQCITKAPQAVEVMIRPEGAADYCLGKGSQFTL